MNGLNCCFSSNKQSGTDSAVSTFSVVAYDSETGELGVAVASHYFAVGAVVPWAEADVGAVATQANVNVALGPRGLHLLKEGLNARDVLERIRLEDQLADREGRQLAIVDAKGNIASFTGADAPAWAGGREGKSWSVQGNLLSGPQVIEAMGCALDSTRVDLAERLFAALKAGDDAGGDSRGRQSACILVVGKGRGRNVNNDRPISVHVDDNEQPFPELRRLLDLNLAYLHIDRAYKAVTGGNLPEAARSRARATNYCINPDTQLRVGFLDYLLGNKAEALALFVKVKPRVPDFEALWRGTVIGRPAFKAILEDTEFMRVLFPGH
ncbi:MAG: DUF1028 domain-containing protein [Candidatus Acidiferrales bacterium]